MGIEIAGNYFYTFDYSVFKTLIGNRDVLEKRADKICESIEKVGYIKNPIIVNKNMEVIDGQGRLRACEKLGIPVYFVVDESAGIHQCIYLNTSSTLWNTNDYANSFDKQGNSNYTNYKELSELFPNIQSDVIVLAISDDFTGQKKKYKNKGKYFASKSIISSGELVCSEEQKEKAYNKLNYVSKFTNMAHRINGNSRYFYTAIMFCAFYANADKTVLYNNLYARQQEMVPFTNVKTCLQSITELYNFNLKKGRRNFCNDYENYMIEHAASNYKTRSENDKYYGKKR